MANVIEYTIRGVDKFSGPMGGISSALDKIKDSSWVSKAAMAAAATAAYALTVKSSAMMEETGKAAQALNLSSSSFSKLAFAAKMAGMEQSQFTGTMMQFSKNVSDASNGLGRAAKGFELLGIDAKKFKGLGMQDQLQILAEKLQGVQNPQDKLAISMRLFGESGRQMNEVLADGGKNLAAFAKDAEHLGVVVTDKAAKAADAFGDSTDRLSAATSGLGMTLAKTLGPSLTIIVNAFADVIAIVNYVINTIVNLGVVIMTVFIAAGKVIVTSIWESLKLVGELIVATGKWMWDSLTSMFKGGQAFSFAETVGKTFEEGLKKATSTISSTISEGAAVANLAFADLLQPEVDMEPVTKAMEDVTLAAETAGAAVAATNEKINETVVGVTDFGAGIQIMQESIGDYVWNMADQTNLWIAGMSDNAHQFASDFFTVMDSAIQSTSDGIAKVIVQGGSFRDMFRNVAKQVLESLISMLVKLGIQTLVLHAITGTAQKTDAMQKASIAVAAAGANGVASMALAPFPLNLTAPAFGMEMAGASANAWTAGAAIGAGVAAAIPIAHGGMTNVPSEQTYLLDRGERVLSPNQNSDLKEFMASGGQSGGGVVIENLTIHILENASNADSLLNMSKVELDRIVAGPILDSLNRLDKRGIRPESQERKRS